MDPRSIDTFGGSFPAVLSLESCDFDVEKCGCFEGPNKVVHFSGKVLDLIIGRSIRSGREARPGLIGATAKVVWAALGLIGMIAGAVEATLGSAGMIAGGAEAALGPVATVCGNGPAGWRRVLGLRRHLGGVLWRRKTKQLRGEASELRTFGGRYKI